MKLLLITDKNDFLGQFSKTETGYQLGSIQIQFIHYQSPECLEIIRAMIKMERFHLVLVCTKGQFSGPFIQNSVLVNTVNNYLAIHLRNDLTRFEEIDVENPPVSIVNRSTSYFNVFLEIPKAVGFTTRDQLIDIELPRLDVLSETNYYLAYYLHQSNCNYYILNYGREFPTDMLIDVLSKLD